MHSNTSKFVCSPPQNSFFFSDVYTIFLCPPKSSSAQIARGVPMTQVFSRDQSSQAMKIPSITLSASQDANTQSTARSTNSPRKKIQQAAMAAAAVGKAKIR
jgi:hypothetical protein